MYTQDVDVTKPDSTSTPTPELTTKDPSPAVEGSNQNPTKDEIVKEEKGEESILTKGGKPTVQSNDESKSGAAVNGVIGGEGEETEDPTLGDSEKSQGEDKPSSREEAEGKADEGKKPVKDSKSKKKKGNGQK